jgi:hypothetical protein
MGAGSIFVRVVGFEGARNPDLENCKAGAGRVVHRVRKGIIGDDVDRLVDAKGVLQLLLRQPCTSDTNQYCAH